MKCGFVPDSNDERFPIRISLLRGQGGIDELIRNKMSAGNGLDCNEPVQMLRFAPCPQI